MKRLLVVDAVLGCCPTVAEIDAMHVPCSWCSPGYLGKVVFDGTPWRTEQRLTAVRDLGEVSSMFLVHPTLTPTNVDKPCAVICDVMNKVCD